MSKSFANNNHTNNRRGSHGSPHGKSHGKSHGKHGSQPRHGAHSRYPGKPRFKVERKGDAVTAFARLLTQTHVGKFVPAKSGGLMAANRVGNRIVFPDKRGPQPQNDGKAYRFRLISDNPKGTVFFAELVTDETKPVKFVKRGDGKIVCIGRRPIRLNSSSQTRKVQLDEFRHASPTAKFEPQDDYDYLRDEYYGEDEHSHGCCCGDDDCDHEEGDLFEQETASIWDSLPTKPVNCFACGFEDCRCDGTASDWVPARTTLNVLA